MVYSDRTLSYKARNPGSTTTDRHIFSLLDSDCKVIGRFFFLFLFFLVIPFYLGNGGGAKGENNLVKNINYKKAFFKKIAPQLYFE